VVGVGVLVEEGAGGDAGDVVLFVDCGWEGGGGEGDLGGGCSEGEVGAGREGEGEQGEGNAFHGQCSLTLIVSRRSPLHERCKHSFRRRKGVILRYSEGSSRQ